MILSSRNRFTLYDLKRLHIPTLIGTARQVQQYVDAKPAVYRVLYQGKEVRHAASVLEQIVRDGFANAELEP